VGGCRHHPHDGPHRPVITMEPESPGFTRRIAQSFEAGIDGPFPRASRTARRRCARGGFSRYRRSGRDHWAPSRATSPPNRRRRPPVAVPAGVKRPARRHQQPGRQRSSARRPVVVVGQRSPAQCPICPLIGRNLGARECERDSDRFAEPPRMCRGVADSVRTVMVPIGEFQPKSEHCPRGR